MIHRNSQGEFTRKGFTSLERHLILFIVLAIVAGYTWQEIKPVQATTSPVEPSGCVEYAKGRYDCSDPVTKAKWTSYLEERNKELEGENGELRNEPEAILKAVCKDHGYTDDCWRVLYGIAMVESRMNPNALSDGGNSLGFFQIHRGYHPGVPDSCRTDLRCSATFTLERMIRMGFDTNRDASIRKHNGSLSNPKTLEYLNKVKSYM